MSIAEMIGATEELRSILRDSFLSLAFGKPYLSYVEALSANALAQPLQTYHPYRIAPPHRTTSPKPPGGLLAVINASLRGSTSSISHWLALDQQRQLPCALCMLPIDRQIFIRVRDIYAEWLGQGHLGSCATNLLNQRPSQTHCPYRIIWGTVPWASNPFLPFLIRWEVGLY